MALSETQMAGLKKNPNLVLDRDLSRVFIGLGLRKVTSEERDVTLYEIMIMDGWKAQAKAIAVQVLNRKGFLVEFAVVEVASGNRVGAVYRTADANVFQRRGAWVMSQLFESVDDLSVMGCPKCEGLVTWDGRHVGRVTKPGMVCGVCGWTGHTGSFVPMRELG